MPPVVEPEQAPMAMRIARMRNAPDESASVSWEVVMFWNPVVVNAAKIMNSPRRTMAGKSENRRLPESDAANTATMTMSHNAAERISMSSKNDLTRPRRISACSVKLMHPSSMTITSTISMAVEW